MNEYKGLHARLGCHGCYFANHEKLDKAPCCTRATPTVEKSNSKDGLCPSRRGATSELEDTVLKHPNLTRDELETQGATFRGDVAILPDGSKYVPAHSREITDEWSRWSG